MTALALTRGFEARRFAVHFALSMLLLYFMLLDGENRSRYDFAFALTSQALAVLVLGSWLISFAVVRRPFPRSAVDRPIGLFLLAIGSSLVFAQDRRVSLEALPPLLGGVLLFYLLVDLRRTRFWTQVGPAVMVIGVMAASLSLAEYAGWYTGLLTAPLRSGEGSWLQLAGWGQLLPPVSHRSLYFVNANHVAALLALGIPFLVTPILGGPTHRTRLLARIAFLALGAPYLLTFSRGGLFAGLVAVIVTIGLTPRSTGASRWPVANRRLVLVLLAGSLVLFSSLIVIERDLVTQFIRPATLNNRSQIWIAAIDLFRQYPLTGIGPGGFGLALAGYADRSPEHVIVQLAHNGLLQIAAELGAAGVAALGWLSWSTVVIFARRWAVAAPTERLALAPVGGALVGFLAANLFDAYYTFQLVIIPVTWLIVLVVEPASAPPRPARPTRFALFVLAGVAALAVTVAVDSGRIPYERSWAAAARGDLRQAERDLAIATERDPAFTFYSRQLGLVRGLLAETAAPGTAEQQAWAAAGLAAYRDGRPGAQPLDLINEARLEELTGTLPAAVSTAEAAVRRDPWDPLLLLNLGHWQERAGNRVAAVDAYARAIAAEPRLRRADFWRENTARGAWLPDIDRRVQTVLQEEMILSDLEIRLRRAEAAGYAGNLAQAEDQLVWAPDTHPRALLLRGWLAEQTGDPAAAAAAQATAVANLPSRDQRLIAQIAAAHAASLARSGDGDAADRMLRFARFYWVDPEIEYRTAQVARAHGDTTGALRAYQSSLTTIISREDRFGPNAIARGAIAPFTLPGLVHPSALDDVAHRARELEHFRADLTATTVEPGAR